MSFRKKISLGVISAVCAFAFVACGDSKGTPKCDDKEVQKELGMQIVKIIVGSDVSKDIDKKDVEKFVKSMKFQNTITEKVDEAQKKATCKTKIKIDRNTFEDFMYLTAGHKEFSDDIVLKPGERLTKDNLEQIMMRMFDEQVKQMDKEYKEGMKQRDKEHKEKMKAKSGEMDEMDKTMEEEWHKAIEEGLYKAMKKEQEEGRKKVKAQVQETKKFLDNLSNLIGELVDSMEKEELKYTAQRTDDGKLIVEPLD